MFGDCWPRSVLYSHVLMFGDCWPRSVLYSHVLIFDDFGRGLYCIHMC